MGESTTWKQRRAFTQLVRNELWHYRSEFFGVSDLSLFTVVGVTERMEDKPIGRP